jgi:hypothetical protein
MNIEKYRLCRYHKGRPVTKCQLCVQYKVTKAREEGIEIGKKLTTEQYDKVDKILKDLAKRVDAIELRYNAIKI